MDPTEQTNKGAGGTDGGIGMFFLGFALSAVALYFFFDSVKVDTGQHGLLSGAMSGRGRGGGGGGGMGMRETTSMGILFLPFLIATIALFVDSKMKWAWGLLWIGVGILVVEILSRIRFIMTMKLSHLLIMFIAFAAGAGLMIRSYRDERQLLAQRYNSDGTPVGTEEKEKVTTQTE